jgi:hypothetical protein
MSNRITEGHYRLLSHLARSQSFPSSKSAKSWVGGHLPRTKSGTCAIRTRSANFAVNFNWAVQVRVSGSNRNVAYRRLRKSGLNDWIEGIRK